MKHIHQWTADWVATPKGDKPVTASCACGRVRDITEEEAQAAIHAHREEYERKQAQLVQRLVGDFDARR